MSIIGDCISVGGSGGSGGSNTVVASIIGTVFDSGSNPTYTTIGGASGLLTLHSEDTDYFTYSAGVFTCQKAGNYTFNVFAKGGMGKNKHTTSAYVKLLNGSTILASRATADSTAAAGYVLTYTGNIAANAQISVQATWDHTYGNAGEPVSAGFICQVN